MKTRERHVNLTNDVEDVAISNRVVEEVLIGKQSGDWAEVRLDEKSQMAPNLEAEAAMEYKGYQALIDRTVDVFGDELTASRWLSMPTPDFDGATPIEIAESLHYDPADVQRRFEPIFIRIEHGIDV